MPKMEGFERVQQTLRRLALKYSEGPITTVVVGYTANYALAVHERLGVVRKGLRQAKYLEQPARELKKEFSRIIVTACKNGAKLDKALLIAGLRLQRESQKLVPVDTGNLRASAFTRQEM